MGVVSVRVGCCRGVGGVLSGCGLGAIARVRCGVL